MGCGWLSLGMQQLKCSMLDYLGGTVPYHWSDEAAGCNPEGVLAWLSCVYSKTAYELDSRCTGSTHYEERSEARMLHCSGSWSH